MKAKQISALFRQFAGAFGDHGNYGAAADLERFAEAFGLGDEKKVSEVVPKIVAHRLSLDRCSHPPASLAAAIEKIESIFGVLKVAAAWRTDLAVVRELFTGASGEDAATFLKDVTDALTPRTWNSSLIRQTADNLTALVNNNERFDATVAALNADKTATIEVLKSISSLYLGSTVQLKSRPAYIKKIRAYQQQLAIERGKEQSESKIAA